MDSGGLTLPGGKHDGGVELINGACHQWSGPAYAWGITGYGYDKRYCGPEIAPGDDKQAYTDGGIDCSPCATTTTTTTTTTPDPDEQPRPCTKNQMVKKIELGLQFEAGVELIKRWKLMEGAAPGAEGEDQDNITLQKQLREKMPDVDKIDSSASLPTEFYDLYWEKGMVADTKFNIGYTASDQCQTSVRPVS